MRAVFSDQTEGRRRGAAARRAMVNLFSEAALAEKVVAQVAWLLGAAVA